MTAGAGERHDLTLGTEFGYFHLGETRSRRKDIEYDVPGA